METILHLFSTMLSTPVIRLCAELSQMLPPALEKTLLVTTGSESNEAALRMEKLHTGGFEVVGFTTSWHGMTAGSASRTYCAGHKGYGPAMPGSMALPKPNSYHCPIQHCREKCDLTCLEAGFDLLDRQSVGAYAQSSWNPSSAQVASLSSRRDIWSVSAARQSRDKCC